MSHVVKDNVVIFTDDIAFVEFFSGGNDLLTGVIQKMADPKNTLIQYKERSDSHICCASRDIRPAGFFLGDRGLEQLIP